MQTFTPMEYLKIDLASNFGLDKKDWDVRIAWVDENETDLENIIGQADEPALFFAGLKAYREAQAGKSIGYPISLDATASGAQLLAVLINCEKSARLCNVISTGHREDLYMNQYRNMCVRIQDTSKIDRGDLKDAIMTSLYGSKAMPRKVFGEGELLQAFYDTMQEEAPGIWELNEALLGLWQSDAFSHNWVLPDNFHVKTKVMDDNIDTVHFMNRPYEVHTKVNRPTPEGLSIPANSTHSIDGMLVREMYRRCSFNPKKILQILEAIKTPAPWVLDSRDQDLMVILLWDHYKDSGFLSARILDYLDDQNIGLVDPKVIKDLIMTMPQTPFSILAIHDCFRVHPNYANDLRRQYNQILHDLAKSELLGFIASQIVGHKVNVNKYGDIAKDILKTDYALS